MAENVKQFKDITLTYHAPAGGTLYVYTDMPGGALALRKTITLTASSQERYTETFQFYETGDNPTWIEGKLIKFKVTSPGTVILYEATVRVRPVGTYIDGASGDVWETQPLSLGG